MFQSFLYVYQRVPSGKHTRNYWNGPVKIVDLHIENGGSFHSFFYVYKRLILPQFIPWRPGPRGPRGPRPKHPAAKEAKRWATCPNWKSHCFQGWNTTRKHGKIMAKTQKMLGSIKISRFHGIVEPINNVMFDYWRMGYSENMCKNIVKTINNPSICLEPLKRIQGH